MTPVAIGMMIFSLTLVGGGFIASIIRLQKISKKKMEEKG